MFTIFLKLIRAQDTLHIIVILDEVVGRNVNLDN